MASRRKSILQAIAARLAQVPDAGKHVHHGRQTVSEDDPLPRLVLVAGTPEATDRTLDGLTTRRWPMTVSGLLAYDSANPLAIEDLLAEIKRAVFKGVDVDLVGLALEVEDLAGETVTDPDEGGTVAACTVPLAVRYQEGYGEP